MFCAHGLLLCTALCFLVGCGLTFSSQMFIMGHALEEGKSKAVGPNVCVRPEFPQSHRNVNSLNLTESRKESEEKPVCFKEI